MCVVENIGGNKEIVLLRIIFKQILTSGRLSVDSFLLRFFFNDLLVMLKYSSWGLMKLEVLELI